MKVLMWLSRGAEVPGGHRVQLHNTAQALRELGVEVHEHLGPALPSGSWDIVHGFQLGSGEVFAARTRGIPVVISTIYWGLTYTASGTPPRRPSVRRALGAGWRGLRHVRASLSGREALTRLSMREMSAELDQVKAWSMADLLLPNAEGEARHIRDDLGVLTETRIVPNAIDADLFTPGFNSPRAEGTVLCVGRVEPHKNQLGTIKALHGVPGVSLTIVGPAHPHHADYYVACQDAATDNVTMLPGVDHTDLPALYAAHRTHVLATWYETTGLASLEAAASGCTVVTTDRGHAREYFGDDAWYCDPARPASIRDAVRRAVRQAPSTPLLARIQQHFTWADTARETLDGYQEMLNRRSSQRHP